MTDRTAWFAQCGWGVFCHYLTSVATSAEEWSGQVDRFDVEGLADQLETIRAPYFFITIGQGSGHYCAPNPTYDRLTGIVPSKCSRRDLVSDLCQALCARGIRLLVYVPADGSNGDPEARRALGMDRHWHDDGWRVTDWSRYRFVTFMRHWEEIVQDWSRRWGHRVCGWWVDGCYHAEVRYPEDGAPNLGTLAAALKAGNPDAIIAFNPGVCTPVIYYSRHDDYAAGEIDRALPECPGAWLEKDGSRVRYHVLSYLGESWCKGAPRFPDELVAGYTRHVIGKGGVITWDVPILKEGRIPDPFLHQLEAIIRSAQWR